MEKSQESDKIKYDPHRRTQYARAGGAFGIEFGKPVKLPNLKRTILNTSRQQLEDRQHKFLTLEKQNVLKDREKTLPRFTSQETMITGEEKKQLFPKLNNKLIKQGSMHRLQRIKSEQNMTQQVTQMIGSYRVGGIIGKGSYAIVRLVKSWKGGVYAMKIYNKQKVKEMGQLKNIQNQILVMEKMNHPNVIKYYESIYTNETINIVMQVVENHSLMEYIRMQPNKIATERNAKVIMKDLLKAISYMHSLNIVHRDIKLENILISSDMRIKLIDFGFSRYDDQIHYDFCGTPHYISPEIISKGGYTGQSADIWAVGIVMYKILVGSFPFKALNDKMLYRKICRGQYNHKTGISPEAEDMIFDMLKMDASMRPSAATLLRHSWFEKSQSI